jgi:hypothetical protein
MLCVLDLEFNSIVFVGSEAIHKLSPRVHFYHIILAGPRNNFTASARL